MKILLVQTPNVQGSFLRLPGKEIPLALGYLAAYLKQGGYDQVRILDLDYFGSISPYLEKDLDAFSPDLVGVTSYTANVGLAGQIADWIKQKSPKTTTVIGGFHASALPEQTLGDCASFDYLVFGEGEQTLLELVRAQDTGKTVEGIAGLAHRQGQGVMLGAPRPLIEPLDTLPIPDRTLVPVHKYIPDPGNYFQLPSTGILFSRGCPYCCTYCSKAVFKNRIRYRTPASFLEEVAHCKQQFGIRDFRLEDEGPTAHPEKLRELCDGLLSKNIRITWNCFSRVDTVDESLLSLMKRAGCYHVTYGLESGSQETLLLLEKKIRLEQAEQAVAWTRKLGIECKVNFILGFPWEDVAMMRQTVDYAARLSPDLVSFNIFKPLPGSVLFEQMSRAGSILTMKWENYFVSSAAPVFEAKFTERELRSLHQRAFFRFHLRPGFILQRLRRLLRHPRRELGTLGRGIAILLKGSALILRSKLTGPNKPA